MNEDQLRSCKHETDITKTCRLLVKFIYPDPAIRARKLVSTMDIDKLKAIRGKHFDYY
jgi:hypothetical protein